MHAAAKDANGDRIMGVYALVACTSIDTSADELANDVVNN